MKKNSDKFYDRLTFFYPVIDLFLKPQKRKFFQEINGYATGRLLEIGVGNGAHFKFYNRHEVIGIDTSAKMLARAKTHQNKNIQLHQMSGEALLFRSESFDYIILSHVIAVAANPEKLLEEAYRVLKPCGKVFILNHVTPDNWLKYLDIAFAPISRLFYFKSEFHLSRLRNIHRFTLIRESNAGLFSYFKILVYEKKM